MLGIADTTRAADPADMAGPRRRSTPPRMRRARSGADAAAPFVKSPPSNAPPGRRVVMLAFPDVQVLDVTGPLEVFAMATDRVAGGGGRERGYRRRLVAPRAGALRCSSGLLLHADAAYASVRGPIDTLVVAGGQGTPDAMRDPELVGWIARAARRSRRVAGVCSGAFLLARAGLLEGRRATTHWANAGQLAHAFPNVRVEPDRIYTKDGNVYTSAGVTAGMDLALALVEEDCGREVALDVARRLVLFLKRPGGQSQFSTQLETQLSDRASLRDLQVWIADHPKADLSVEAIAKRAAMSPRHFARVFTRELGVTPARYVERARVEVARRRLEETELGVEEVAAQSGFGSAETLRRAFLRNLSVSPVAYRARFRDPVPARMEVHA